MNDIVHPVILCGGSGTRLWPLSRKSFPKQFANIFADKSLFQMTAERFNGDIFSEPFIITSSDYRFIALEQLGALKLTPSGMLVEPGAKNTAAAACVAALELDAASPDSLMLLAPSDHVLQDIENFKNAIECAIPAAKDGRIITFGVYPDSAETGYGWLELSEITNKKDVTKPINLLNFVEKPPKNLAEKMLQCGNYLWNSGIFLFKTSTILKAFQEHAPEILEPSKRAILDSKRDLWFKRLDADAWDDVPEISIDFAIMEKASNLSVMPLDSNWSDLGDWKALWKNNERDERGVVTHGSSISIASKNSLIFSSDEKQQIIGIGLEDMIVVGMPDAVLVAHKDKAQDVKAAVEILKQHNVSQAEKLPRDYRPWGWYESLVSGSRFQVKRIVVTPGSALSLQSHNHRSEHWVVVEGTAKITINDEAQLITENQSVYIPLGCKHRLENPGKVPLTLIEVQTGPYLGEDDIIRYDDLYARDTDC